jgi:glycine cleavage system H lipoate-binding protein
VWRDYEYHELTAARYTTDHEWVTLDSESNIGTVGITDYAQKALGDVVFVELPAVGTDIAQGGTSSRYNPHPSSHHDSLP